jgi:hypothetical protein
MSKWLGLLVSEAGKPVPLEAALRDLQNDPDFQPDECAAFERLFETAKARELHTIPEIRQALEARGVPFPDSDILQRLAVLLALHVPANGLPTPKPDPEKGGKMTKTAAAMALLLRHRTGA